MTVMCVLPKITGLRDKIRVTEKHDVIVRTEERGSPSQARAKKRGKHPTLGSNRDNDVFEFDKNCFYVERGSQDGNELTIKIGLAKTGTGKMEMGNGPERVKINHLTSFDSAHRDRQAPVLIVPAPKRNPNRVIVGGGVSPAPQHWESMIAKYLRDKIGITSNDDAKDGESVLNSKSSQFPSKEFLAREIHTAAPGADRESFHYDEEYEDNNKKNCCDVRSLQYARGCSGLRSTNKIKSEPVAPTLGTSRRSRFKRMALEFFDIFGAIKRYTNHVDSQTLTSGATRTKTLYQNIPADSKGTINDRPRVKIIYRSA